jgi:hypothetical protein
MMERKRTNKYNLAQVLEELEREDSDFEGLDNGDSDFDMEEGIYEVKICHL